MSFVRKIKRNGKVYLAEVENKWIDGKCVQRHIRYVGRQVDGETKLNASISDIQIDEVKLYGPLLVLNYLAEEIDLAECLGTHGKEILSLVYAHCLDYKSVTCMESWFKRTDLNMMLSMDNVTEKKLLNALDSLEELSLEEVQKKIFNSVKERYHLKNSGVVYDVTNTYLYGKKCPMAKLGHDKEGVKGRPLIQIGLGVTKNEGIPMFHKVFDGNVADARTLQDLICLLRPYQVQRGFIIYDRGIMSGKNLRDIKQLHWQTLTGMPLNPKLKKIVRTCLAQGKLIQLKNRIHMNKTVWYMKTLPYELKGVKGTLALCFNEEKAARLRESRYDEITHAQKLLQQGKTIKPGLDKYFYKNGILNEKAIEQAEEFDGYSLIFSTQPLSKERMASLYFRDKDIVERAFKSIKGVTRVQPVRHWLYNRVTAHVFICYLAYLLLSLLQYRLKNLEISSEDALLELDTMYKVYMRDKNKDFKLSRVVALTKQQETILKTINRKLLKA